jgi:hypothetical protein
MFPPPMSQHHPLPQHSLDAPQGASQFPQQICPSDVVPQTYGAQQVSPPQPPAFGVQSLQTPPRQIQGWRHPAPSQQGNPPTPQMHVLL